MKKRVIFIILIVLVIIGLIWLCVFSTRNNETDNIKFSKEYTNVGIDNVFIYKTADDIISILEHGTGVVFLGFPECQWCQKYVTFVNDIAKNNDVVVNYFNISNDRKENTSSYQKMVSILSNQLASDNAYDKDGHLRIFVPTIVVVKNGEIVGFDDETAHDTKNYKSPDDYWKNEDLDGLKQKLDDLFKLVGPSFCSTGCND